MVCVPSILSTSLNLITCMSGPVSFSSNQLSDWCVFRVVVRDLGVFAFIMVLVGYLVGHARTCSGSFYETVEEALAKSVRAEARLGFKLSDGVPMSAKVHRQQQWKRASALLSARAFGCVVVHCSDPQQAVQNKELSLGKDCGGSPGSFFRTLKPLDDLSKVAYFNIELFTTSVGVAEVAVERAWNFYQHVDPTDQNMACHMILKNSDMYYSTQRAAALVGFVLADGKSTELRVHHFNAPTLPSGMVHVDTFTSPIADFWHQSSPVPDVLQPNEIVVKVEIHVSEKEDFAQWLTKKRVLNMEETVQSLNHRLDMLDCEREQIMNEKEEIERDLERKRARIAAADSVASPALAPPVTAPVSKNSASRESGSKDDKLEADDKPSETQVVSQ
ncbi:unnamed protein product [Symbiodinium sp. CCMP2592]|nr:unnamed protein product [Symbiodinium sp. CCMP2592]CAE7576785.1 unnamed protein product [Symbiodinium sp. CCMP2592]